MTKSKIVVLMVLDLFLIAAVGYNVWNRYNYLRTQTAAESLSQAPLPTVSGESAPTAQPSEGDSLSQEPVSPPAEAVAASSEPVPGAMPEASQFSRKTFTYDGPTAKTVMVVGDFNQWEPQPLARGAKGRWSLSVNIKPGSYSYQLVVDGKKIRDPYQRRTDEQGRSLITAP